jgi:hypothetical protein
MRKRKLIIALTVLAAAAFAGGAYAATQDSPSKARQAYLGDAAKRLHVTPAQLNSALTGAYEDQLNAAVKAGRITQAQANAIKQRIQQNGGVPLPLAHRPFRGSRLALGGLVRSVAGYLKLTPDQLLTQLRGGKSLAQIAQAQGKTTAGVEQAIRTAVTARLDKAVAAHRITSAEEQQLLARLNARLDKLVNRSFHIGRWREVPRGAPGWGRGGGPGPGAGGATAPGARGGPGPGAGGAWWGPPPPHPGSYVPAPGAGPSA